MTEQGPPPPVRDGGSIGPPGSLATAGSPLATASEPKFYGVDLPMSEAEQSGRQLAPGARRRAVIAGAPTVLGLTGVLLFVIGFFGPIATVSAWVDNGPRYTESVHSLTLTGVVAAAIAGYNLWNGRPRAVIVAGTAGLVLLLINWARLRYSTQDEITAQFLGQTFHASATLAWGVWMKLLGMATITVAGVVILRSKAYRG
ncbi:MAG: hypothetical protein V9E83_13485 [Baekduia sp.]